jgi:peptidoglycan hydrolase-like protein with peptidoglycan-binding domain
VPKSINRWSLSAAVVVVAVTSVGMVTLTGGAISAGTVASAAPGLPGPGGAPSARTGWDRAASIDRDAEAASASGTEVGGLSALAGGLSVPLAGGLAAEAGTTVGAGGTALAGPPVVDAVGPLAPPPFSPARVNPWLRAATNLADPATAPVLGSGDTGPAVTVLEQRLTELGYRPGPVDDTFDRQTASAVLAFQKAENLERSGEVDAATWARLPAPQAWSVTATNIYPRVEVDIARQIVLVVFGPQDVRTLNTSTGGGYTYRNERGGLEVAETPIGDYRVYDAYDGTVKAPLGTLYRPLYFEGGYAIHGSPYVPSYPDSHGCVRLSNVDMDWLFDLVGKGMPVSVFDTMDPVTLFGGLADPAGPVSATPPAA